ncbi:hypothetical protein [Streptomyces subrutilus]|uniref:hypothetical protein n=1 Tax=Streptomyces subrutilus TaxID=36818 RepID=UPI002E10E5BB|nr:hypothetical protein OG479_34655 [Streptomyces subrutilus]
MIRRFRRCGHSPGIISPEGQAAVDEFRAMLAAVREPEPWTRSPTSLSRARS